MAADDDPFELIKRGNAFEKASDHWRSAEFYSRASTCLRTRADDMSSQIRGGGQGDRKVVSLFRAQSLEYLYKARHCLLEALRFENDQDRSRTLEVAKSGTGSLDPLFSMISEEESVKRRIIFEDLFAGSSEEVAEANENAPVADVDDQAEASEECGVEIEQTDGNNEAEEGTTSKPTDANAPSPSKEGIQIVSNESGANESKQFPDDIDDRRQSIESRLASLDSSLLPKVPPPFVSGSRSSGDRLEEIQAGLGRLGVTLPDSSGKRDFIPENLSDEDQVKLIIQQAKDEVRVEKGTRNGGTTAGDDADDMIDENDSMFEGFEDDDYDIDALLTKAENLVARTGSEANEDGKFCSEVVQIRKIQALLLEARLCLEIIETKSTGEQAISNKLKNAEDEEEENKDMSENESNDFVENNSSPSSTTLAARKKARGLIENAQDCMNQILRGWK